MKAYKNYMDRIRLDEEQHDRLMEAVKAAEAAEAAKKAGPEDEAPAKVSRFPLKRLGWIASAAAVIVMLVAVVPKSHRSEATPAYDRVTEANAGHNAAPEFAEQDLKSNETPAPEMEASSYYMNVPTADTAVTTAQKEGELEDLSFSVIYGTAEYRISNALSTVMLYMNVQDGSAEKTAEEASEYTAELPVSVMEQICEIVSPMTGLMEEVTVPEDVSAEDPDASLPVENTESDESAEPVENTEPAESTELPESTDLPESAEPDGRDGSEACTEDGTGTEKATSMEYAVTSDDAIAFAIGEDRFDYDSEEGLLSADGREYRLSEEEKKELNSLLDSIIADR